VELENLPEYPDESIGRRVNDSSDIPIVPTVLFLMTDLTPFSSLAIGIDKVMVSEKIIPTTNGSPFELYQYQYQYYFNTCSFLDNIKCKMKQNIK